MVKANSRQKLVAARTIRALEKQKSFSKTLAKKIFNFPKSQRSSFARKVAKNVNSQIKKRRVVSSAIAAEYAKWKKSHKMSHKKSRSHKKRSHRRR